MGIIQRLMGKRSSATSGYTPFDPFLRDPEIHAAARAMIIGDFAPVETAMRTRVDASLVGRALTGETSPLQLDVFERWANQSRSALSLSVLGAAQTQAAWAIRGRTYAKDVDQGAWGGFSNGLEQAESTLQTAATLDPSSALPWAYLLRTARGLGMSIDEKRTRFTNAHSRAPFDPDACDALLQGLCQKWGGSHAAMFEFARWIETDAPADSPSKGFLHLAHLEYQLAEEPVEFKAYWALPDVSAEAAASAEKFLAATPREARTQDLTALNHMVLSVFPVDQRSAGILTECIHRVDDRATASPWDYWGEDPGLRYNKFSRARLIGARAV